MQGSSYKHGEGNGETWPPSVSILRRWYTCQNSQKAKRHLMRVRKVSSGLPGRDFQDHLLHAAKLRFRRFPPARNRVCIAQEILWGLSAGWPQMTSSTLRQHFGHMGCFDTPGTRNLKLSGTLVVPRPRVVPCWARDGLLQRSFPLARLLRRLGTPL